MTIDLYHIPASSPCRAVRLVAAAIGLDINLIFTNLWEKEHYKPEFIKMNPQHAVPTLNDNGFYLAESRAICTYLIDKYAKDDSLYPKDPQQRAIINQRLFFDMSNLYYPFVSYYVIPGFLKIPQNPEDLEKTKKGFDVLEKFLEGQNYVAGDHLTVADIVLATTVSISEIVDFDLKEYKNTSKWFAKVTSALPKYQEINGEGLKEFKTFIDSLNK